MSEVIEDATIDEGKNVLVTERNLINSKWQIKKKKYNITDYYNE
ncbi:MAG: hypothetical protein WBO76_05475 [Saprospiraceae bacterium]